MNLSSDLKVLGGLLGLALALGGAGLAFPGIHMLIGLAAVGTAAFLVVTKQGCQFALLSRAAFAILALALLLPLLQLVPLPPDIWMAIPGRQLPAEVDLALGMSFWRPLSLDVEGTLRSFLTLIPPAVVFIAALLLPRGDRKLLLWVVLAFALLSAALGIVQAATGGLPTLFPSDHKGFATGLFVNRNHNAVFLIVAIPIAAGLSAAEISRGKPSGFWMVSALSSIILLSLGVIGTTSRMGLVLLPLAILAALLLLLYRRARTGAVVVAIAIFACVAVLLAAAGRLGRVLERFSGFEDSRLTFWTDVHWALDYYGYWGTGFGTFMPVFKSAESLESIGVRVVNHAHNDFLEIALEGGWPALLLLAAFLVVVLLGAVRRFSSQKQARRSPIAAIATLGIAFLLVASLVDYPLRMTSLACVMALFVALLMPSSPLAQSHSKALVIPGLSRSLKRPPILLALAGLAAIGVLAIQAGASAHDLLRDDPDGAIAWAPWSTAARVELSSDALFRNDLATTEKQGVKAVALSPISAPAIRSLGIARLAAGGVREGNQLMQAATVLGWRDPLTQLWAIEAAKTSREPEKAVQRAEALFRQGEFIGPATGQLLGPGTNELTTPFLTKALSANPPWRDNFFKAGKELAPGSADGWIRLVTALRETPAAVTQTEGLPSLQALIAAGRTGPAQTLWRLLQRNGQLIANGDFEQKDPSRGDYPALWHLSRINRGLIRTEVGERSNCRALHIRGSLQDRLTSSNSCSRPADTS